MDLSTSPVYDGRDTYAVQQDTQSVSMSEFYSALFVSSTCFGPHRSNYQERFVQAVFADFGMWYYCAYYSTRPVLNKLIH